MEYLEAVAKYTAEFEYWQQLIIFVCGILFGYILHVIVFKLRIKQSIIKHGERSIVLIEPRNRKYKKDKNAEYFRFIKTAQYSQNEWLETENKGLGVSTIERD